jgi:ubiquinone/menaquinone biosynthesis C-methylase UbiE
MSILTEWLARRHGGLAVAYEKFTAPMERAGVAEVRARLAGDLAGRTLEVGCGTGLNFPHYPASAEVTAIEPIEEFRTFASERARTVAARVIVTDGDAERLPFADESFDAALCTLVFCSIPDALRALGELRRVVRSGGSVRFFEHVRSERVLGALVQDLANPIWRRLMDGCNLNRDTVATIRAAGFHIDRVEVRDMKAPRSPSFPMREVYSRVPLTPCERSPLDDRSAARTAAGRETS